MTAAAVLALFTSLAPTVGTAQGNQPVAHSGVPDSTLRPAAVDEEFASWLHAQLAGGRSERPQLVQAGRFEALVLSPLAAASLAPDSVFASMVELCRAPLQLDAEDVTELVTLDPWAAFDAAASAVPVVTIAIVPAHAPMIDCGANEMARHAALARGIRFGRNPSYSGSNDAVRAELVVNGAPVTPLLAGRAEVTQVAQSRLWENGTGQVRLYVPIDALAPTAAGRMPQVRVHVWNAVNSFPDTLAIPEGAVRALWDSELHWRAARLANANVVPAADARPVLPMPRDSVLRRARERLDAGDHRAAATLALGRLEAGQLSREDQRIGRLQLAFALDAEGEEAGTRVVVGDAMRADPCLTFAEGSGERYRAMLEPSRPAARCTWRSTPRVLAMSLLPGFAQLKQSGRTTIGVASAGLVLSAFIVGKSAHAQADATYEKYQQYVGGNDGAATLYDDAARTQARGNTFILAGAGVWAVAALDAVLAERRHRDHLKTLRGFGEPRSGLSLSPVITPRVVGVSLAF